MTKLRSSVLGEAVWNSIGTSCDRSNSPQFLMERLRDAVRLYGTVQDRDGRAFTGYISWNSRELLASDILDGYDEDGERQRIPFGDVREVSKTMRGALVTMASGVEQELNRRTDAGRGHRGVGISDVCLGRVEVEWDDFRTLQLRRDAGNAAAGRSSFGPAYPLSGSVVTQADEKLAGRLRWNADKEWSWNLLKGRSENVEFAIELGRVALIETRRSRWRHSHSGGRQELRTWGLQRSGPAQPGRFCLPVRQRGRRRTA